MNLPLDEIAHIFSGGGFLSAALAAVGFAAFYLAFSVWLELRRAASSRVLAQCARDIKAIKVLASAAPMIGLLGTVMGIGMCAASAEDPRALADGVSYALLTTQTGLIISIPAWIAAMALNAKLGRAALAPQKQR